MTDQRWDLDTDRPAPPSRPGFTPPSAPAVVGDTWQARPANDPLGTPAAAPTAVPPTMVQPAYRPQPIGPTAPPSVVAPAPIVETKRSGGWGWQALVAFVAGGALTAAGFGLGVNAENPTSASAPTATTPQIVVAPPELETAEPAAFVADILGPSVVQVEHSLGLGSGVVFAEDLVMTNNHVIADAAADDLRVRTADGRVFSATVLGSDPRTDIAVVQLAPEADLPIAGLAVDVPIEVGQYTVAIGSPFQLQQTVTSGIVSAVNRPIQTSANVVNAMIQTDTAINPGNSGGALADRQGRVIGINTAIQTDGFSNSNVGVGFAVPIDVAVNVAQRILDGESLEAGYLGVGGGDQEPDGASGVVVGSVQAGTAAEAAGLQVGDRVVRLDDSPITSITELAGLIQTRFPGDEVAIEVVRDGETLVLTAVLGER